MCHHHLAGADMAWEQGATCNGHTESEPSLALLELRFILPLPGIVENIHGCWKLRMFPMFLVD